MIDKVDIICRAASEILGKEGEDWQWLPVEGHLWARKAEVREGRFYAYALFDLRENFQGNEIRNRLRRLKTSWEKGYLF